MAQLLIRLFETMLTNFYYRHLNLYTLYETKIDTHHMNQILFPDQYKLLGFIALRKY